MHSRFEQGFDEIVGIEILEIVDADVANRNAELPRQREDHAPLRGAVEFGQRDAGQAQEKSH